MNYIIKKTICIDLDGVLNEYKGEYNEKIIPKITKDAEFFLEKLNKNYNLVLFTTRDICLTKQWLKENSIDKYITEITNIKKPCFLYIDDRAICYKGNYNDTIMEIENFEVYWKQ